MIAVIADDFTGAAELAGICVRYHLRVELATEVPHSTNADVFILATDCRSMKEEQAVAAMKMHTEALLALQPSWLFKKTDSVLRGHILAEIAAQLTVTGYDKAVLVAANPALGRTITDGLYFVYGQPVHETSFSHDPDFPVVSSSVKDILRADGYPVYSKKSTDTLPDKGIIAGDVKTVDDLTRWAAQIDNETLAAGASGFFEALLSRRATAQSRDTLAAAERDTVQNCGTPVLFVCGTTFSNSRDAIQAIYVNGGPVSYMPEEIIDTVEWADEVTALVRKHGKAIVAIHAGLTGNLADPHRLGLRMAALVKEVLQRNIIRELIIEGGATSWAVLQQSGLTQFFPVEELTPGVVRMQTIDTDLFLTVKPGSYNWPAGMWDF